MAPSPYRDERKALEDRRNELRDRLTAVEVRAAELNGLLSETAQLREELASLDKKLAAHDRKNLLPLLDAPRTAASCSASWEAMEGDERVRFCAGCQKHVYNLSALSRDEAEALVLQTEGKLCVRMYQRADGTLLTSDCSVGVSRRRKRRALAAVGAGALAALTATAASMHTQAPTTAESQPPCARTRTAPRPEPRPEPQIVQHPQSEPVVHPEPAAPARAHRSRTRGPQTIAPVAPQTPRTHEWMGDYGG